MWVPLNKTKSIVMKKRSLSPLTKYLLAWIPLPGIAIFNGVLRDLTYSHIAGEHRAHQISSILLSMLVMLYVNLIHSHIRLTSLRETLFVSTVWLLLTVAFEASLGLAIGRSLNEQLENYNVFDGNLWPLVLLSVFFLPIIFRKTVFRTRYDA